MPPRDGRFPWGVIWTHSGLNMGKNLTFVGVWGVLVITAEQIIF